MTDPLASVEAPGAEAPTVREAFCAGFRALLRGGFQPPREWVFDGIAAADLEPEAWEAWQSLRAFHDAGGSALSRPASEGWQPIESAPKDGTPILALAPYGPDIARWASDGGVKKPRPGWRYRRSHSVLYDLGHQPTGWMPLPAPPAASSQEANSGK